MSSNINNVELSYDDLMPVNKLIANGNFKEALSVLDILSQKFQYNNNFYKIVV